MRVVLVCQAELSAGSDATVHRASRGSCGAAIDATRTPCGRRDSGHVLDVHQGERRGEHRGLISDDGLGGREVQRRLPVRLPRTVRPRSLSRTWSEYPESPHASRRPQLDAWVEEVAGSADHPGAHDRWAT